MGGRVSVDTGVEVGCGVLVGDAVADESSVGVGADVAGIPVAVATAKVNVASGVGSVAGLPTKLCAAHPTPQASAPNNTSATTNTRTWIGLNLNIAAHPLIDRHLPFAIHHSPFSSFSSIPSPSRSPRCYLPLRRDWPHPPARHTPAGECEIVPRGAEYLSPTPSPTGHQSRE